MPQQDPTSGVLQVSVWRGGADGGFQVFEVPRRDNQTVLDVATHIQRHLDPPLSYRYACRGGMCGSCAMTVTGVAPWTCRPHGAIACGACRERAWRDGSISVGPGAL